MSDYISREALLSATEGYDWQAGLKTVLKRIPAADVRPVVRGRWIDGKCNQCGEHAPFWPMATTYYKSKYCPNCGADMREES